jgi:hypothetical protein
MNFLTPLAILFGLLVPVVVLLYLLKLKRREVVVSTTLLWKRSIEDLTANAPFQKLRRNLLLLLQILFILLVTFLLMRPFVRADILQRAGHIVLIDNSASMQARDVDGRTRLSAAQDKAVELVESLTPGDRMMVMAFSEKAEVIENWTPDKDSLRRAIGSIEARDLRSDLEEALTIALTLARDQADVTIQIISDGRFGDLPEIEVEENRKPVFIPVGESGDNIGITAAGVSRVMESHLDYQVLAGVQNFSDEPRRAVVELRHGDVLLDAKEVAMEPLGTADAIFAGFGRVEGVVELKLSPVDDVDVLDVFPLDDRAWTVLPEQEEAEVLLVTGGNPILLKALDLDPNLNVTVVSPAEYTERMSADLTVFDASAPASLGPGRYIFFGVVPPVSDIIAAGTQELPVVVDWNRSHPVNRFVEYENLQIEKALRVRLLDPNESLVQSNRGPLLAAFERTGGIRGIYVGFDIYDSAWPLRFSFPIFLANSTDWLLGSAATSGEYQFRTGRTISVDTGARGGRVRVTDPRGVDYTIDLDAEESVAYFGETDYAGVYEVRLDGETRSYAGNLMSPEESEIRPRENLDLGNQRIAGTAEVVRQNIELWRPLALLALLLLSVEWWVYSRKVWI